MVPHSCFAWCILWTKVIFFPQSAPGAESTSSILFLAPELLIALAPERGVHFGVFLGWNRAPATGRVYGLGCYRCSSLLGVDSTPELVGIAANVTSSTTSIRYRV